MLGTPGPAPLRAARVDGSVPHFTLLLAGRDIVYCYYRTPCKNQDQRTGLVQPPNTDTLMLVKVDGTQVSVLNIPRDTNVGEFDPQESVAAQKVNSRYWSGVRWPSPGRWRQSRASGWTPTWSCAPTTWRG